MTRESTPTRARYVTELASFDRTIRQKTTVKRPETVRHLEQLIQVTPRAIARGAGLSYSAASFGSDVVTIDMTRFDRVLDYDESSGRVTVEPGITVGSLTHFLAKKGRYVPCLPGYPTITVGGCVAFDTHGKSQVHSGNFGRWVQALTLCHRDHGTLSCDRDREGEVFELTVGGLGQTGIITQVVLDTVPLPSTNVRTEAIPVKDLHEAAELLGQHIESSDSSYSWHDLNQREPRFGQGVVYVEHFVPGRELPSAEPARSVLTLPGVPSPVPAWNALSTPWAIWAYGQRARRAGYTEAPLNQALFPIRGKEYYYMLFGRQGFREYQLIVPHEAWHAFVNALQRLLTQARMPVTLGSLKVFAGTGRYLRFAGTGICLAVDVPATPRSLALFREMDELVVRHQGVVNLSKDSRLDARLCRRVFPEYDGYLRALQRFDPERRYRSTLTMQIGL